jgi:hypothetical protein
MGSFENIIKRAYLNKPRDEFNSDNLLTNSFRRLSGSKEFTNSYNKIFNTTTFKNPVEDSEHQTSSFFILDNVSVQEVNRLIKEINNYLLDEGTYKKSVNYLEQISLYRTKIKDNKLIALLLQTQANLVEKMINLIKQKIIK